MRCSADSISAGVSHVSITLDVYSHVLPTDDRDTAARTAAFILGRGPDAERFRCQNVATDAIESRRTAPRGP